MSVTDHLSIQLYTLRSLESLDSMLDIVAEAGYRYVETVGSHLDDAANVRAKLDARGLKASSSHVSLAALREKPEARRGRLPDPRLHPSLHACGSARSSATWRPTGGGRLGANWAGWRERFQDQGIRLGYHNHHWELKPKDGSKTALECIFEAAEGSPLTWEVDVAWLVRGDVDPKEWIEPLPQQDHRRPREGHRPRRPERG